MPKLQKGSAADEPMNMSADLEDTCAHCNHPRGWHQDDGSETYTGDCYECLCMKFVDPKPSPHIQEMLNKLTELHKDAPKDAS